MHYFDRFGWYTSTPIEGREADVAPENTSETDVPGQPRANWTGYAWVDLPYSAPPPDDDVETQFDRDRLRYEKRAAVKDQLLAYMAADNMSRVRAGEWTVADLTSLLADPVVATANQFMSTLSFELAAQSIASASTPLLTPAIRADWIARLEAAFFTEG